MKHINSELVQKYIDNEASHKEKAYIEEHLLSCAECRNTVDEQKNLATKICGIINVLSEEVIEIPVFDRQMKEKSLYNHAKEGRKKSRVMLRWSLSTASAACILIFIMFMLKPKKETPIKPAMFFYGTENEFDANRSISQQDIVVKMVDSEGNVSEFNL